jgi:hypothetical protein
VHLVRPTVQLSSILLDLNSKLSGLRVYKSSVSNVMQVTHQLSSCYVQQMYGQKDTLILIGEQQRYEYD